MIEIIKILYKFCFYDYILEKCEFNMSSRDIEVEYLPFNYELKYLVKPGKFFEWWLTNTTPDGYVSYEILMHSKYNREDTGSVLIKNDSFTNFRIYWFMLTKIFKSEKFD